MEGSVGGGGGGFLGGEEEEVGRFVGELCFSGAAKDGRDEWAKGG